MRALFVIILSLFNVCGAGAQDSQSTEAETFTKTPASKAWTSPMTETTYSSKIYRMICDFSKQAPFTQGKSQAPCTMTLDKNVEYIQANMPKPCDGKRGKMLREFIGPLCESIEKLQIQEYYFYRVETCNYIDKVEDYIGRQKCLTSYKVITPCIPHTHKDGTVHDCKNQIQGH